MNGDSASRSQIPPDVKEAIRRRAREIAGAAPDLSQNPVFRQWMRDTFLPAYYRLLEEREAANKERTTEPQGSLADHASCVLLQVLE